MAHWLDILCKYNDVTYRKTGLTNVVSSVSLSVNRLLVYFN